jgi:hypothetical protein
MNFNKKKRPPRRSASNGPALLIEEREQVAERAALKDSVK